MTEIFEVVDKYQYFDEWGHEHWDYNSEGFFINLENAYEYCIEQNAGCGNELPLLSEIEGQFYPCREDEFDVGYLTILKHLTKD